MTQTHLRSEPPPAFEKVSEGPCRIRCQTRQALVEAVADRDSMYTRNAIGNRSPAGGSSGVRYNILASNGLPFCGEQEIRFFDANFGLIISDFTLTRDFDYEFIYENLGFIQFRTGVTIARRPGRRGSNVEAVRPSCRVSVAPNGHVDNIHYVGGSNWQTITAFFDMTAIERLLDFDAQAVHETLRRLQNWRGRPGDAPQMLSAGMLDALRAVRTCPFTGPLRRAFFEAKTTELVCLSLGLAAHMQEGSGEVHLTQRVRSCLEHARHILDTNSANSPTLAELARRVGVNRRTLATGFRQLYGTTVYQYTLGIRMTDAKTKLSGGRVTIAEIADEAGYSDLSTFSRAFHRHYGHPPSYYLPGRG